MEVSGKFSAGEYVSFYELSRTGPSMELKIGISVHVCRQTQIAEHVFSFFAV
jgi:hypothetical protein